MFPQRTPEDYRNNHKNHIVQDNDANYMLLHSNTSVPSDHSTYIVSERFGSIPSHSLDQERYHRTPLVSYGSSQAHEGALQFMPALSNHSYGSQPSEIGAMGMGGPNGRPSAYQNNMLLSSSQGSRPGISNPLMQSIHGFDGASVSPDHRETAYAPASLPLVPYNQVFAPARALYHQPQPALSQRIGLLRAAGFSVSQNYQGDINMSNLVVRPEESCSLYLRFIPADASPNDVFESIFEGGVFSFSLSPPTGQFTTAAAHLVFKTRKASEDFHFRANQTLGGVRILGRRIKVSWNRNRYPQLGPFEMKQSRVLRISGPTEKLTAAGVELFFHYSVKFELAHRREWLLNDGSIRVIEFGFNSILGQSRVVMKCFHEYMRLGWLDESLKITYAPDFCDRGSVLPSGNLLE